jgi:dihydroorotase
MDGRGRRYDRRLAAIPGGCAPDTCPTFTCFQAIRRACRICRGVMSKFLTLGYSLEQVVTMATSASGAPKIGTLQIGAPCDVAIMEVVEGPVSIVDTRNNQRDGKAYLKPIQTVINGAPFGRPYQSPFAVR